MICIIYQKNLNLQQVHFIVVRLLIHLVIDVLLFYCSAMYICCVFDDSWIAKIVLRIQ